MARPPLKTVHYFPYYVKEGRTLFLLENKYGCTGTGFFTNVLRILCETPDHHFSIEDEVDRMMFFGRAKIDEVTGLDMIQIMIKTGKLDKRLWEEKTVICSVDLLESIKDAYSSRNNNIITLEEIYQFYNLFENEEKSNPGQETGFTPPETPKKGLETQQNGKKEGGNPQSIIKKSKKKESINTPDNFYPPPEIIPEKTDELPHIKIPIEFHRRLNERLCLTTTPDEKENMRAHEVFDQVKDIGLVIKCLDAFFDDSVDWYFTRKSKKEPEKRIYRFNTFCSVITDLISHVRQKDSEIEQEEAKEAIIRVKSSPPRRCPKCGKIMLETLDTVGCKKCKVIYEYRLNSNSWEKVA